MGEDPYLVSMLGVRLRAGAAERRRHRHAEALRRLLRLAGRPQPRPGVDGPPRAPRHHPADLRDRRRARRRRLGDELLLRRRRRAGRRGPVAAHRGAARRLGLHRHGRVGLLGRAVPRLDAPASPPTPARRVRWRWRPGSTSSCPTPSASASSCRRVCGARRLARGGCRRPGGPAGAAAEGASSACSTRVDAGGLGRARRRASTSTRRPTGRSPASSPSGRVVLLDPGTALPLPAGPPDLRRVAVVGPCADDPRTFMGCYAFPNHVLPRYPDKGSASTCRPRSTRCAPSCPTPAIGHASGCAVLGRRPLRLRGRRRRRAGRRRLRGVRRRPGRPLRPRHLGRGLRRRGPAAAGRAGRPARRAARDRHPGRRGRRLGPPVRARRVHGRAAGARAGVHARRGGRRGDRRHPLRSGRSPAASSRCRSRAGRAASRAPTSSRRSGAGERRISTLDPTPLYPFGHGRSYTSFELDRPATQCHRVRRTDGEVAGRCPA